MQDILCEMTAMRVYVSVCIYEYFGVTFKLLEITGWLHNKHAQLNTAF